MTLDYSYSFQETLLDVQGLNVSYDRPILRDLSLTIKNIVRPGHSQGQINVILGPSGMGKTQLFRVIAGIQQPTSGTVKLMDSKVVRIGDVGVVYQEYPLLHHLTVFDNLMLAGRKRTPDAAVRRTLIEEYLEAFGVALQTRSYPNQLSGGQRQRVSIIQQVISCGHKMLMDEPFAALDILRKEEVQALLQRIAASHELNTIIATTHDIPAALAIADTVHLLGLERDANGVLIPGARIVNSYNLMDMGITWRPDNHTLPEFRELEQEIRRRFHEIV